MVAASKYKRQEHLFNDAKKTNEEILDKWKSFGGLINDFLGHPFLQPKDGVPTYFVFMPEKGLCGGLVTTMFKAAKGIISGNIKFIGAKGGSNALIFNDFMDVYSYVSNMDINGPIFCLRPTFKNVLVSNIITEQIFPLEMPEPKSQEGIVHKSFLDQFFIHLLSSLIWNMVLESRLCEYSSRMVAMDSANKNASNLINKLDKLYHSTRQAQITKELIEIVAGSASY